MDWKTIELLGYTHFSKKGYRILVPLVDTFGYDFVAEKDGHFVRVNVKLAGIKDPARTNSWSISVASGASAKSDKSDTADIFLAYVPSLEKFLELPGDFFKGSKSKSRCIPVALLK